MLMKPKIENTTETMLFVHRFTTTNVICPLHLISNYIKKFLKIKSDEITINIICV